MDSSLAQMGEVFRSAQARERRSSYKLFAFLLATSMDRSFLVEYLKAYHELHHLSGRHLLIIGPGFDREANTRPRADGIEPPDLDVFAEKVAYDVGRTSLSLQKAPIFLNFLAAQTRESYAVARFLNLRLDSLPLMVFMEDLATPRASVAWPLGNRPFQDFFRDFRSLTQTLETRCGWDTEERIKTLQTSWSQDQKRSSVQRTIRFREALARVRLQFDAMIASAPKPIPSVEVGKTLAKLESGEYPSNLVGHLLAHAKRWGSRIPEQYKDAIVELERSAPYVGTWDPNQSIDELNRSLDPDRTDAEIAELRLKLGSAERPLAVVAETLNLAAHGSAHRTNDGIAEALHAQERIPRVFISYSHDSPQHKAAVVALAQRLRRRNIDAWLDQFEIGPEPGFPRWMAEQILQADKVILVCTDEYRARFDLQEKQARGVTFEAHFIYQDLYDVGVRSRKFVPVTFNGNGSRNDIPRLLRGFSSFQLPDQFEELCHAILEQPLVRPAPLPGRW